MSFKSYAVTTTPNGSLLLEDPQPLVLSGPNGLIARFILSAGERAHSRWTLCPGELHAAALPGLQTGARMIVFEQSTAAESEMLVLDAIYGTSAERTEMMFSFHAVDVTTRVPVVVVCERTDGTTYIEELTLEGGVFAPAAHWNWRRPHLHLGGVVCG